MVTITDYKELQKEDGTTFCLLQIQGGVELVKSQETGKFYLTAKKAYLPSTFDKNACESLKGTQIEGQIIKEECDPYDYTNKDTGEVITLTHKWTYIQEEEHSKYPYTEDFTEQSLKPAYA